MKQIKMLMVVAFTMSILVLSGCTKQKVSAEDNYNIEDRVMQTHIEKYNFAKRNGSQMDICIQAGVVKSGFLRIMDEENFRKWKQIQAQECAPLGMPVF